jgi:hypothetical protein
MTKTECRADAKKRGLKAVFVDGWTCALAVRRKRW